MTEVIHYTGILANPDASIQGLKLRHGFRILTKREEEVQGDLPSSEGMSVGGYRAQLHELAQKNDGALQVVTNTFQFWGNEEGYFADYDPDGPERDDAFLVPDYLEPVLRLMRLFKDGDLRVAIEFYTSTEDGVPSTSSIAGSSGHLFVNAPYRLDGDEVPELQALIDGTKVPFKLGFVNLALDFFELSGQTQSLPLSFVSLMVSLEVLFNPGGSRVSKTISRYVSMLLGEDQTSRERIYEDVLKLYDKRSRLIHDGIYDASSNYVRSLKDYYHPFDERQESPKGDPSLIERQDLDRLKNYVRRAIIKATKIDKPKPDLLLSLKS